MVEQSELYSSFENRVELTNDEATDFKAALVRAGYYKDPFVHLFSSGRHAPRHLTVEMSRGYFVRVKGIRNMAVRFVDTFGATSQIFNMGGGFDTLHWHLRRKHRSVDLFVDVDFPEVIAKKREITKRAISQLYATEEENAGTCFDREDHFQVDSYHMVAADLRSLDQLDRCLRNVEGLDCSKATLFVFECVLMYLEREDCRRLLAYLATKFSNAVVLCYEPTGSDRFMEIFQENMNRRGLPVPGLKNFADADGLHELLESCGWLNVDRVLASDLIIFSFRISKLHALVDPELLSQMLSHYAFMTATNCAHSRIQFERCLN